MILHNVNVEESSADDKQPRKEQDVDTTGVVFDKHMGINPIVF